jgi:hypothetical protein
MRASTSSHVPAKTSRPLRPLNPGTRLAIPRPRHGVRSTGFLLVRNTSPGGRVDECKLFFFIKEEVTVHALRTRSWWTEEGRRRGRGGGFDNAKLQRDNRQAFDTKYPLHVVVIVGTGYWKGEHLNITTRTWLNWQARVNIKLVLSV